MRICIVTHYFPPEIGAPQARLSEMARSWAETGEVVTVLTGMPNHPTGVIPERYRGRIRLTESVDGYEVVRCWLYATPNEGVFKKTIAHISFMFSSILLGARRVGPQDVVLVSSPTFFSILSGWLLARLKKARLVVEIRDLWPALIVDLGVLKNRLVIGLLEKLELASYRAADLVVVVSQGFKVDIVGRGIPREKVKVITNGVDIDRFEAVGAAEGGKASLGAGEEDVVALYIGAHGISQGLTAIAEAAALIESPGIHVAFVGEGAAKSELEERVQRLSLENVTLHPGVPSGEVPALVAAADICLVPLRHVPLFETFIPSKIFEFLAAGKPIVGSVRGEAAEILEKAGQPVVPPEDAGAIAAAIENLASDPLRRAEIGSAGRSFVKQNFDRRALAARYRELMERAVSLVRDARAARHQ